MAAGLEPRRCAQRGAIRRAKRRALVWHRRARARPVRAGAGWGADFADRRLGRRAGEPGDRRAVGCDGRPARRSLGQHDDAHGGRALLAAVDHFCNRDHHDAGGGVAGLAAIGVRRWQRRDGADAVALRRLRRGVVADDGAHRARAGPGVARAAIRRGGAVAWPRHVGDLVAAHSAERRRRGDCLPDADAAGGDSVRVVFELPRAGHPAAESEPGVADRGGRSADQPDTSLLVDDRLPGWLPCGIVDGTQLSRRWTPRCIRSQGRQGSLKGQALAKRFFFAEKEEMIGSERFELSTS